MKSLRLPYALFLAATANLFFTLLQSACAAFMPISGLRLLIGIGSLAAATTGMKFLASLHGVGLRIRGSGMTLYLGFATAG